MEARSRRRRKQTTTKMNLQNLLTAFSWKHPENARDHLSLIGGRTPSLRTAFRIRDVARKPIQLLFAKSQHSNNLAFTMPNSGFWDSL